MYHRQQKTSLQGTYKLLCTCMHVLPAYVKFNLPFFAQQRTCGKGIFDTHIIFSHAHSLSLPPSQITELAHSPTNCRRKIFTFGSPTSTPAQSPPPPPPLFSLESPAPLSAHEFLASSPGHSATPSPAHSPQTSRKSSSEGKKNNVLQLGGKFVAPKFA